MEPRKEAPVRKQCPTMCGLHAGAVGGDATGKEREQIAAVFKTGG
jgi:hypothetical protein